MSDSSQRPPHFLRVVRALARVSGVSVPIAAVVTSFAAGCSNDPIAGCQGFCYMGTGGSGTSSSTGGQGGAGIGLVPMDGGYDGAAVGLGIDDAGYDGGPVGNMVMPDGGSRDGGSDGGP